MLIVQEEHRERPGQRDLSLPEMRRVRDCAVQEVQDDRGTVHVPELRLHRAELNGFLEVEELANAIVTLSIMPESPSVDLKKIEDAANRIIDRMHGPGDRKAEIEPVAFGLNRLKLTFVMDEKKGSPDPVAEEVAKVEGVQSATVIDVRRAIG